MRFRAGGEPPGGRIGVRVWDEREISVSAPLVTAARGRDDQQRVPRRSIEALNTAMGRPMAPHVPPRFPAGHLAALRDSLLLQCVAK
jgi:hypothetical protein